MQNISHSFFLYLCLCTSLSLFTDLCKVLIFSTATISVFGCTYMFAIIVFIKAPSLIKSETPSRDHEVFDKNIFATELMMPSISLNLQALNSPKVSRIIFVREKSRKISIVNSILILGWHSSVIGSNALSHLQGLWFTHELRLLFVFSRFPVGSSVSFHLPENVIR